MADSALDRYQQFGSSVAISGATVVVGAEGDGERGAGSAYVFASTLHGWQPQARFEAQDANASLRYGSAVAVAGNRLLIAARSEADRSGSAYLYVRDATGWVEGATLSSNDTTLGKLFARSIAVSEDTMLLAGFEEAGSAAAYIFSPCTQTADCRDDGPLGRPCKETVMARALADELP